MMNKTRSSTLQLIRYGIALSLFAAPLLAVSTSFGQQQKAPQAATSQKAAEENNRSQAPLIIVDGKEQRSLTDIDPKKVKSMQVFKAPSKTMDSYGEKGANGVIKIDMKSQETEDAPATTEVTPSTNKPLLVVDGKIAENTSLVEIQPDHVESVIVLKGEKATAEYGEAGKNGVIQVNMKK